MTLAEQVITELRRIRFDRPPPLSAIAQEAGLHRTTLYEATGARRLSEKNAIILKQALQRMGCWPNHNPRPSSSNSVPLRDLQR